MVTLPALRPTLVALPPLAVIAPSKLTLPDAVKLILPASAPAAPVLVRVPAAALVMAPPAVSVRPPEFPVIALLMLMLR